MRILVLDEEFPYPLDSGKRIRSFNLYARLAARCELHYLAYGSHESEGFRALRAAGIHPIPVPASIPPQTGAQFYLRLLANLLSPQPYIVSRHYSRVFQREVVKQTAELRPDLIVCEWTPYAVFVRDMVDVPRVVVAHNIEAHIWRRYFEHEKAPLRKWYIARQMTKVAAFERAAFNWVDGAVAVSDAEAAEIRRLNPAIPVQTVENGVDLERFVGVSCEPARDMLIFVGAMNWRPNQDAVCYFVKEVLPLVRRKSPQVSFVVVGQAPPPHIRQLNDLPGVRVLGRVEDVRPHVAAATLYVVPLRIGGGTRLKILEALAMKKAVVSTSVGAEGLEITDGESIMIADEAEALAAKIDLLLRDAALRKRLGEEGRRLVERRYGWDQLAGKLEAFLSTFVKAK